MLVVPDAFWLLKQTNCNSVGAPRGSELTLHITLVMQNELFTQISPGKTFEYSWEISGLE